MNRFVDISAHARHLKEQQRKAAEEYTATARGQSVAADPTTPTPQMPPQARRGVVSRMLSALTR